MNKSSIISANYQNLPIFLWSIFSQHVESQCDDRNGRQKQLGSFMIGMSEFSFMTVVVLVVIFRFLPVLFYSSRSWTYAHSVIILAEWNSIKFDHLARKAAITGITDSVIDL
jgi:hypothetical protein